MFPAPAGMNRSYGQRINVEINVPRTSGDEPVILDKSSIGVVCLCVIESLIRLMSCKGKFCVIKSNSDFSIFLRIVLFNLAAA